MSDQQYRFEDIREFIVKRQWFVGDEDQDLFSPFEYEHLKNRVLVIEKRRAEYLRAFIDGWTRAKA